MGATLPYILSTFPLLLVACHAITVWALSLSYCRFKELLYTPTATVHLFFPLTANIFLFWCIQINLQASCSSWLAFWRVFCRSRLSALCRCGGWSDDDDSQLMKFYFELWRPAAVGFSGVCTQLFSASFWRAVMCWAVVGSANKISLWRFHVNMREFLTDFTFSILHPLNRQQLPNATSNSAE